MKSNKTMVFVLIISLASVFTLVGIAMYRTTSDGMLPDVTLDSLLGSSSCSWPCWQGITPGVTTSGDALQRLKDSPFILTDPVQVGGSNTGFGSADWSWRLEEKWQADQGKIEWRNSTVYMILLNPYHQKVSIGQIINKFGPPEKIDIVDCTEVLEDKYRYFCAILFYAKNGFDVSVTWEGTWNSDDFQITPSDPIVFIALFKPSTIEEWISSWGLDPQSYKLQDWKGYGNLLDLYNQ